MTNSIKHKDENGLFHHDTEPAIVYSNGDQYWFQHGKRHRDNDLPAIVLANGTQWWHQYGIRHRTTGPDIISPTTYNSWYVNGQLLTRGKLFNLFTQSIYSCFPSELVGSPIFDYLLYNTTDPIITKLA